MRSLAAPAIALALALGGCGALESKEDSLRKAVVGTALDQVGEDYRYGGADPHAGFDCSGLAYYSYRKAGITLPRSAKEQHAGGRFVKFTQARAGDLLFYDFADRKKGDLHVVIYLGNGEAVHAPVRDGEVEKVDITKAEWKKRYVGARRYIAQES